VWRVWLESEAKARASISVENVSLNYTGNAEIIASEAETDGLR